MSLNLASTLKSDRHFQSHLSIGEERWQREQTTIPDLISLPNLQIDPEFNNLIPPLSHEEKSQLEANLKKFGCIDSLVVWQGTRILLDGHNRYSICTQLQIPYKIVEIEIPDREAAICWIANHQLGRRNITPETISYLRGKRYLHLKGNREDNLKQNLPNGKSFLSVGEEEEHLPNGKSFLSVEEEEEHLPNGKSFLSVGEEEEHLPNGKSFLSVEEEEEHLPNGKSFLSVEEEAEHLPNGKSFLSVGEEAEHLPNGKSFLSVGEEAEHLPNGKSFLSVEEEAEHLPNGKSFLSVEEEAEHLPNGKSFLSVEEEAEHLPNGKSFLSVEEEAEHLPNGKSFLSVEEEAEHLPNGKSFLSVEEEAEHLPNGKSFLSVEEEAEHLPNGKSFLSVEEEAEHLPNGKSFLSVEEEAEHLPNGKSFLSVEEEAEHLPNGKSFLSVEEEAEHLPNGKSFLSVDIAKSLAEQYKVSDRTIRNDAQFTSALDTIAQALGDEVKHSILTRTTGISKKDVLSLARVVRNEGKETAQKLLNNKLSKCDIVQQIKNKQRVPNPHYVGEVCTITAKGDVELKQFSGCWGIILEVNPHSCAVRTWKMDSLTVKPENLEPIHGVCKDAASQNCTRIQRLAFKVHEDYEPTHMAVLEALSRIPDPSYLTSKQERMLAFLEQEYELQSLY